ncbi:MAG: noncanonical pyrimidine nucleotidase, YjjG family [Bacteroidetes bacterium GWE2_39_28]|nr:MAG: noncanonical pyrimidine nucleotidase, YjjG family [Bacteroidetes bacterium GWE2_39_28]OFY16040.1 MAG: noncanonical pyrimidine nucleotidase, YjjG family [Bacteroidetes bacterium GWF2_39_10]OFZ12163.1 MAG: noncanonical pyrimidine nucleotidase, YjjG family [Bacteroidetes bacterium RIFOXYC2_FULL_39_11]
MLNKEYKYILFDLDRTLWDLDLNAKNNVFRLLDVYGLSKIDKNHFFEMFDHINHLLWARYEKGDLSKEALRSERFYQTLLEFGVDNPVLAAEFGEEYLKSMPLQKALTPYAFEVLSGLHERGVRMAIISNGFKEVQYKKLENSGIAKFFDAVMISEEQGVHKPSPILFKRALNAIGGDKKLSLMVGDDFVNDIEGAMIFGIDQFFYNYKSVPCDGGPTYDSNDLRDLLTF